MLIKCPYCRCLQSTMLPPKVGFKPICGINTKSVSNITYVPHGYIEGKCDYTIPHLTNPNHVVICDTPYVVKIDNGKCYCYIHKYLGIKLMWDETKQQIKKEKMEAKLKEKQEKARKEKNSAYGRH